MTSLQQRREDTPSTLFQSHQCLICKKAYKTKEGLNQHNYYKHSTKRPTHKCSYCNYSCYMKSTLQQHLLSCSSAKKNGYIAPDILFKCDLCKYAAKQKGNLDTHRSKMHNIKKPSTRITRNTCREKLIIPKYIGINTDKDCIKCWMIHNKNTNKPVSSSYYTKKQCDKKLYDFHTLNGLFEGSRTKNPLFLKEWSSFENAFLSLLKDRPRIKNIDNCEGTERDVCEQSHWQIELHKIIVRRVGTQP